MPSSTTIPNVREEYAEVKARSAAADAQVTRAMQEIENARQAVEALAGQESDAWQRGDGDKASALADERVKREAAVRTWVARYNGAQRAADEAYREVTRFAQNNAHRFREEYAEEAEQVRAGLEDALRVVGHAASRYQHFRIPGCGTPRIPEDVTRSLNALYEAIRVLNERGGVPAIMPEAPRTMGGGLAATHVNPEVRSDLRGETLATAQQAATIQRG